MIDCNTQSCETKRGESKYFEPPIYFHNVRATTFANNGTMTFKNPAYFSANNEDLDLDNLAEFSNVGTMNFESNAVFHRIINTNGGVLNFNADMNDDSLYAAVNGNIFNDGTINANGQVRFSADRVDSTYNGLQITVIVNDESGTFNVNGKARFEQVIYNAGSFYVYNNAAFEQVIHNFNGGLFIIERPTSVNYWLNNQDGAILHIKGTTLTVNDTFWNFRDANLVFSVLNGRLGQLVGDFINYADKNDTSKDNGKVQIIVTGLSAGQRYQIIDGQNIMLDANDISFINGRGQYLGGGLVLIDEVFAIKTPIIAAHKANIASMSHLFLASNAIMSNGGNVARFRKMANLRQNKSWAVLIRAKSRNDESLALDSLESNESFFYDSQILLANARSKAKDSALDSSKEANLGVNQNNDFFFILTPFVNHTRFFESSGYNISGLDYGFVAAFGGNLNDNNTLGTHFAVDYSNLGDSDDRAVKITNLNLMLGLNYRLGLAWDMFVKARGDFYYFLNEVSSSDIARTKPNNLGFGLSAAFGKDFDFDSAGVLGVELGLDYKMLNTDKVSVLYAPNNTNIQQYESALYHLLYVDLGLNYYKYFSVDLGLLGIDAGLGVRGNLTPKISHSTLMVGNRATDITIDNDNVLGYLSVGGSFAIERDKWAMEFTLRYNGSFGDKSISNGGSFEWRILW